MSSVKFKTLEKYKNTSTQSGFTLIEVLISVMILAGSIVIISNVWSGNLLRVRKFEVQKNVSYLLEQKILEIEELYSNKPIESIPEESSGEFGKKYPKYSWNMISLSPELDNLDVFKATSDDSGVISGFEQLGKTFLKDSLKQNFKEVKVSVTYTIGTKNISFSLTTLFVNPKPVISTGGFL